MTLYHVLTGAGGQQFYLNQYNQAIPLTGAGGADGSAVAIYTGNHGESWYVDKNGQQIDLSPTSVPPPVDINNQPASESSSDSQDSSGGGTALAAGVGAAVGSIAGSALDLAVGGIPYGMPVYWGGAGGWPYYIGRDGNRTYINNVNNQWVNQWKQQHNWYRQAVNNPDGRYHGNWWPGQEHGFPRPGQQVPGRLYSPSTSAGAERSDDLMRRFGGSDMSRFDDRSEGNRVFGGGHFGGGFGGHSGGFRGR